MSRRAHHHLTRNPALPTFETDRLILRDVDLDDAPSWERNFSDYEVIRQLSAQVPWPYPEGGARSYLETEVLPKQALDQWVWGICFRDNPRDVVGAVEIFRHGRPENRGFWLGRSFWGRGLMTEALQPVMCFAFEHLGFERMIFTNALGNVRSRRIKEKTGARLIGITTAKFVDPDCTHQEIWELTSVDWTEGGGSLAELRTI